MSENIYAVEMEDICKSFGAVRANRNINFRVLKGEIHAIVGENGAGKTTLMNILFGALQPTSGRIRINGQEVTMSSPNKAIRLGIGMVHQHFELVPSFTVAENIMLGHESAGKFGAVDKAEIYRHAKELAEESGLKIDPYAKVGTLSVGLRQRVEILKALSCGAQILILDEPTAVLTPNESDELFEVLRRMSAQGKTIILITHKLKEVMAVADHITVLRQGETCGTLEKAKTNHMELAALMMGKSAAFSPLEKTGTTGEALLRVDHITARDSSRLEKLKNVTFDVHAGQILTIAGVEGNGQTELVSALLGFLPVASGSITALGTDITKLPVKDRRNYCSYIPEDRMTTGLDLAGSVHDNLIAGLHNRPEWRKGAFIDYAKTGRHVDSLIDAYAIKTDGSGIAASSLSGGNQQKIVVAREMNFGTKILIVSQPSRGVDIGATRFIHEQIIRMRNEGCAILLISTDLDEVFALSDEIKVIFEGSIVGTLSPDAVTPQELGLYMTGAKKMEGVSGTQEGGAA